MIVPKDEIADSGYDLIPENARQREIDVEGIIKMRRALACLK